MKRAMIFACFVLCAQLCLATTIHVPTDQPTIQAGIDAAVNGDTVLVNDGHYLERINFRGKNIVVGSYFLIDEDTLHVANTIIDGDTTVLGKPDSGSVVLMVNGEDSTSVLCGLTITNGVLGTPVSGRRSGGGLCVRGARPWIRDCVFSHCGASDGGAIYIGDSKSTRIEGSVFIDCHAGSWGGAIYNDFADTGPGHVMLKNSSFTGNSATQGGAVWLIDCSADISCCSFTDNNARNGGGAIWSAAYGFHVSGSLFRNNRATYSGSAVKIAEGADITINDCLFEENTGQKPYSRGGAIYSGASGDARIQRSTFLRNSAVEGGALYGLGYSAFADGCVFLQNSADWGGGAYVRCNALDTESVLGSCTFARNTARLGGGALFFMTTDYAFHPPVFSSSSFVDNSAPQGSWFMATGFPWARVSVEFEDCLIANSRGGPMVMDGDTAWLDVTLDCCNIYGNEGGDWISYLAPHAGINGNISADPLFCDPAAGDFHIQSNSPCAPANNSCGVLIGALPVACGWSCGDVDGSGVIQVTDAVHLVTYLFGSGAEPLDLSAGDVNRDGHLNIADVVYLINYIFLGGPAPCAVIG